MRNPLDLQFHIGYWQDGELTPEERLTLEIADMRERLQYYNKNVKSLSSHATIAQIYIDGSGGHYKVFCNCHSCSLKPDYNPNDEVIYLKERAKEVKRIKTAIDKCVTYPEKLNCLFTITAGKISLETLQIWDNVPMDRENPDWRKLHLDTEPIINLNPESKEDVEIYNKIVKVHLSNSINQPESYPNPYNGFLFQDAKAELDKRMVKAINPSQLIDEFIGKIEKHFNYPDLADYNKPFTKLGDIDMNAVFNLIAKGNEFDYSATKLAVYFIQKIIHIEQILRFYKYLLNLKSQTIITPTPDFTEDEIKMQTWEYHIRQFIDIATRWEITGVYKTASENHPYSSVLGGFVIKARIDYENFKTGLRNYLNTNGITDAMRIDLEDRYGGMLSRYDKWYKENEQDTLCFEPYNPYKIMNVLCNDTLKYILRFFPQFNSRNINENSTKEYQKLQDLFIDPDSFNTCIDVLRSGRVQIIDNSNNFILGERQKGAIVAWVEVLKARGKIKQDISRSELAALLNTHFAGLNISDRTLSNVLTTSANRYHKVFTSLIS